MVAKTRMAPAAFDPQRVMGIAEFCTVAGVSRPTFYRWLAHSGLKEFSTRIGSKWRMTGSQYARWIESRAGIHDSEDTNADDQDMMSPGDDPDGPQHGRE